MSPRARRVRYALRRAVALLVPAVVAAALVLADAAGLFGRRPAPDAERYDGLVCRVMRVIDGDTIDVETTDGDEPTTRVRLWGVDTPEVARDGRAAMHFGPQASAFTRRACIGRLVRLELEPGRRTRDKYRRLLAWVSLPDGRLLNRLIIEEGRGYADPRFEHERMAELERAQKDAMTARRGLWAEITQDDLPYYLQDELVLPTAPAGPSP
jgi:endonuclease YncB( thermonuclease family)